MEQLPHLAMYCHGMTPLFVDNVTPYMLEIIVQYITDCNHMVSQFFFNFQILDLVNIIVYFAVHKSMLYSFHMTCYQNLLSTLILSQKSSKDGFF